MCIHKAAVPVCNFIFFKCAHTDLKIYFEISLSSFLADVLSAYGMKLLLLNPGRNVSSLVVLSYGVFLLDNCYIK